MSRLARERTRPFQFELRYLYGVRTRRERFGAWFRLRVRPAIEFTISVSYLCGLVCVLLLWGFRGVAAPQINQPSQPLAIHDYGFAQSDNAFLRSVTDRSEIGREAKTYLIRCCGSSLGPWVTQTVDTASQ
jgi:hypothetical protein